MDNVTANAADPCSNVPTMVGMVICTGATACRCRRVTIPAIAAPANTTHAAR